MRSSNARGLSIFAGIFALLVPAHGATAGPTLDKVKATGTLTCGVSTGLAH